MSDPFVTFSDVQAGAIELLTAQLPLRGYPMPPTSVGAKSLGTRPRVMVRQDTTPDDRYPAAERQVLRVTCWHASEFQAKALAQVARAILLSTNGTAKIRTTSPLTGPAPGIDPDTDEPLASFTVYAHARPIQV